MLFNFFGTLNSILIVVSLIGVFSQVRTVWLRKRKSRHGATEILSLNKFFVSFLAYYSFFVYGMSIEPFNHFIVWPRLIAALLVAVVLYEIWIDRKAVTSFSLFAFAVILLVSGVIFGLITDAYTDDGRQLMAAMIVIITIFLAQGYIHQIMLVIKLGSTGALDIKMSQLILLMDFSTIAFAIVMGLEDGWPLLLLAIVSASTKIIILYLFRWVRISKSAERRRLALGSN
ncbi:hypothetical protein AWR38_11810 [Idiomarina sp. WRN-38]|uniref:hypothetical protein n=1 Tax=Idiomarina sp. OXR-189 TaxID=3100175 RepID=UPI000733766F|nr:hypothetical protein [Idiomarina sp. OXR-189]KTG28789.1 hypothetical protein AUR68_11795 [Idiomarina sp. H105]OAF09554.1 hypothetical protein AWR38_11810 [Idiomarina sp. WRN-38]WPZ01428.1 hypothetical protein UM402_00545 [Idiomarina sp. OXR-189]|tara:strand:+ start:3017 stop:3706 length:690 start_codon:yes stop_codon:yes gene_type:complete